MRQIVIYIEALSQIDKANLKEFNREHKPVTVTVVDHYGTSQRYKLTEEELTKYIIPEILPEYYMVF